MYSIRTLSLTVLLLAASSLTTALPTSDHISAIQARDEHIWDGVAGVIKDGFKSIFHIGKRNDDFPNLSYAPLSDLSKRYVKNACGGRIDGCPGYHSIRSAMEYTTEEVIVIN